jgi:hypothetical protein
MSRRPATAESRYLVIRSGAEKLFERAGFSAARSVTRKV